MDIFDYAKQMEKDGEKYYRELASKADREGLKSIFNMLADDEVKHYEILDKIQKNQEFDMADSKILDESKNIFTQKKENATNELTLPQKEAYKKAVEIEQKSVDFYKEKAKEAEGEVQKKIFNKLAHEELKHRKLIENIIEHKIGRASCRERVCHRV